MIGVLVGSCYMFFIYWFGMLVLKKMQGDILE